MPIGVYFQQGAWRYKAKSKREREVLGKLWTRLGASEEDVHRNYWDKVGSRIGATGGMELLWKQYEEKVLPQKKERTAKDDKIMWQFLKPVFGICHPSDISRADGIAYLEARGASAPSRAKKEFALLRHMLNKAVDWEIIERNPLQGTRVADYVKVAVRDRVPDLWELVAVKKHAIPAVDLFIDFKYQTGLDQAVIFALKIPDFSLPGIPVERSKTRNKGLIEWTEDLKLTCRALIALNNGRSEHLFCNSVGKPWRVDSFSQRFREAVKRAITTGDLVEPFTPNDIRSSYATDGEELYGRDATAQLLHSSPNAKKHYVHLRRGQKIQPLPLPRIKSKDNVEN